MCVYVSVKHEERLCKGGEEKGEGKGRRRKERKERRHARSRWGAQRVADDQGGGDGAMRQGRRAG